jgi:hypothetical protein
MVHGRCGWYEEIPRCGCGLAVVVVAAEEDLGFVSVGCGRGAGAAVRLRGIAAPETWTATLGGLNRLKGCLRILSYRVRYRVLQGVIWARESGGKVVIGQVGIRNFAGQ